jgi:hypothetical protein
MAECPVPHLSCSFSVVYADPLSVMHIS